MRSNIDLNSYDITLLARKNANKVLLLLAGSLGGLVSAQATDSLKINTNAVYVQEIENINQLPITYANQNIKDFTHTEVYFNYKKNEFSRKQTASETSRYGFKSQGLFNIKDNLKVFGTIDLQKYTEKNLAYTLDDTRTDDIEVLQPHYYFVPRASDWNNQQYNINAGVIKSFGNFNVAAKVGLYADKLAREVDPRPEISNRKLSGEIQAGYTLGKHQIFALAGYSLKDKDYSYYYSNPQLNEIALPETYIRFNSGFGRVINRPFLNNTSSFFTRKSYKKIGGGYNLNTEKTSLTAHYTYQRNLENWYDEKFRDDSYKLFQYETVSHQGGLRLKQKFDDKVLRTSLNGHKTTSKNYDVKAFGTNYMNRQRNITFDANLLKEDNQFVKYFFGLYAAYNQNRYMDQLGYVDQKINSVTVGVYGNRDFQSKNNRKFNLGLGFNYYTAIKHQLDFLNIAGSQENVFYNEIIAHDYIYNSMDKLDAKADIRYILPVKNNKNFIVYTQLRSIFALDNNRMNLIDFNTETTYQVNVGIQLNY